jgi:hypothetical protein
LHKVLVTERNSEVEEDICRVPSRRCVIVEVGTDRGCVVCSGEPELGLGQAIVEHDDQLNAGEKDTELSFVRVFPIHVEAVATAKLIELF